MLRKWTTPWSTDLSLKKSVEYKSHPEQNVPHPYSVKANQKSDRSLTQCIKHTAPICSENHIENNSTQY